MRRVAIQGGAGAYHGIAAENFFSKEEVEIIPCATFRDVFKAVKDNTDVIGIIAIENTIAGSLLSNYELLKKYKFPIVGEYKLHISHCFVALPNQTIHDIKEVQSHPIALMQCTKFLETLPGIKVVEHEDTALAARDIAEGNIQHVAAICSRRAAEMYHLQVLAEEIETNKRNFTRFLIFVNEWMVSEIQQDDTINKASIVFTLPHTEGSLSKVLSVFSFYDINLTKIQSLPIIGQEWNYQFYVDFIFDNVERYRQALVAIKPLISELRTLGEYASC